MESDGLAEDMHVRQLVAGEDQILIFRIFSPQQDHGLLLVVVEALQGGLLIVYGYSGDLSVLYGGLFPNKYHVAVVDPGIYHGIPGGDNLAGYGKSSGRILQHFHS